MADTNPPGQEAHLTPGNYAQVIGKVNPDLTVKVLNSLDLGANVGTYLHTHTHIQPFPASVHLPFFHPSTSPLCETDLVAVNDQARLA